jgi:hypothetical protein
LEYVEKTKKHIPSGYVKIAIENDPVEIVDFPIKNGGSFHSYVTNYQRVSLEFGPPKIVFWNLLAAPAQASEAVPAEGEHLQKPRIAQPSTKQ